MSSNHRSLPKPGVTYAGIQRRLAQQLRRNRSQVARRHAHAAAVLQGQAASHPPPPPLPFAGLPESIQAQISDHVFPGNELIVPTKRRTLWLPSPWTHRLFDMLKTTVCHPVATGPESAKRYLLVNGIGNALHAASLTFHYTWTCIGERNWFFFANTPQTLELINGPYKKVLPYLQKIVLALLDGTTEGTEEKIRLAKHVEQMTCWTDVDWVVPGGRARPHAINNATERKRLPARSWRPESLVGDLLRHGAAPRRLCMAWYEAKPLHLPAVSNPENRHRVAADGRAAHSTFARTMRRVAEFASLDTLDWIEDVHFVGPPQHFPLQALDGHAQEVVRLTGKSVRAWGGTTRNLIPANPPHAPLPHVAPSPGPLLYLKRTAEDGPRAMRKRRRLG